MDDHVTMVYWWCSVN